MSDRNWQECRERFTAMSKAVKELAGGAPLDSRTESLKGESNSREVANGEGTISSQPMSDHAEIKEALERKFATGPLACDSTHTMFWNVLTKAEKELLAQFVADAIRDARLKEAEW